MREVNVFYNSCLRKICNIYWPNKIRIVELRKKTDGINMSLEIYNRRLRWLGHVRVLRVPEWTPSGRRKRGRPKTTWRRTVMKELEEMGLTWGEAQTKARHRSVWRSFDAALCPKRDEEDE